MNIRTLRNKIRSVGNVKKITRAMQLVSAVKMKKAQEAALAGRPYHEVLEESIKKVQAKADPNASLLLKSKPTGASKQLIILATSNKGLCGAFNLNLLKYLISEGDMNRSEFITLGKKGSSFIAMLGKPILADFSSNEAIDSVSAIIGLAIENFLQGKYLEVKVFYNRFISSLRIEPAAETILPLKMIKSEIETTEDYLIEPRADEMLDLLLRNYMEEKLNYILIQNEAGEHSARMIAMKNATDNANELIYGLTLQRNKLRQQKITYELLDMVTAKESVEIV